MEYLTTAEFAKKWGISQRRVGIYCKEGRLEGAMIKGNTWLIPADAKKPEDPRKTKKRTYGFDCCCSMEDDTKWKVNLKK